MRVFYGYEVESNKGIYLSWEDCAEPTYPTPEAAREEGAKVVDRWTAQGERDVTLNVVRVTVENVVRVTVEDEDEYE